MPGVKAGVGSSFLAKPKKCCAASGHGGMTCPDAEEGKGEAVATSLVAGGVVGADAGAVINRCWRKVGLRLRLAGCPSARHDGEEGRSEMPHASLSPSLLPTLSQSSSSDGEGACMNIDPKLQILPLRA